MLVRYRYIDRLKGFAILLVILGHLLVFSANSTHYSVTIKFISSVHMQLFMFVSGYLSFKSISSPYYDNLLKVLRRIPRYICPMYIVGWLLAFYMLLYHNQLNVIAKTISTYAYWGNWYWYLKTLSIFTIMSLPIMVYKNKLVDVGVIIFSYILFYALWKHGDSWGANLCMEHAICFYPYYAMGLLCRKHNKITEIISEPIILCMSLILYVLLFNIEFADYILKNLSSRFVMPMCAIIVFRYLFEKIEVVDSTIFRELEIFGKQSLDIYLFHYFFVFPVNFYVLDSLGKEITPLLILLIFVGIAICTAYLSMLVGNWIRKSNMLSILLFAQSNVHT